MVPCVYPTITVDGEQLISQLSGHEKVPLFAEADRKCFPGVVDVELEVVKDGNGNVTELILHQHGASRPMKRLNEAVAKRAGDEAARGRRWPRRVRKIKSRRREARKHSEGISRKCGPASRNTIR